MFFETPFYFLFIIFLAGAKRKTYQSGKRRHRFCSVTGNRELFSRPMLYLDLGQGEFAFFLVKFSKVSEVDPFKMFIIPSLRLLFASKET